MPKHSDFFAIPEARVPRFGSGEVATILGTELWRLNRFLSRYELKSSGRLGEGRGSRRTYTVEDVYRIRTAMFLVRDGFSLKLVAQIMQLLEDKDFHGGHNESGEFSEFGIALRRGNTGPEARIFRAASPPKMSAGSKTYYALSLSTITREVTGRISDLVKAGEVRG